MIDPSIPLSIRPSPVPVYDPLAEYGKVLTLKGLMQQGSLRELEMQNQKLAIQQAQMTLEQQKAALARQEAVGRLFGGAAPAGTVTSPIAPQPLVPLPITPPVAPPPAVPFTSDLGAKLIQGLPPSTTPPVTQTMASLMAPVQPPVTTMPAAPVAPPQQPETVTAAPMAAPQAAAPGRTILPVMQDPFKGLPTTAQILQADPVNGFAIADKLNKNIADYYKNQNDKYEAWHNQLKGMADLADTAHDEKSKNAAVLQGNKQGWLTDDQARELLAQPYNKATWDGYQTAALSAVERLDEGRKVTNQLALDRQHQHEQAMYPAQEEEAKAKSLKERVGAASYALRAAIQQSPQSFANELAKQPTDIQQAFSTAKTPADVDSLATTAQERITAAETKREHDIRAVIDANQEARKQEEHYFTYGAGANAALMNVDPKLRAQVQKQAQKYADDYNNAMDNADRLQTVIDLARSGNKAAFSNLPVIGVQTLNALNGIRRMPKSEIDQYQGAGSLLDKIQGRIEGLAVGQTIPKDVMDNIESMHNLLRQQAESGYQSKLDSLNQNSRSNFQHVKRAQQGAGTVKMKAPDGTVRDIPANQVDHYKSKGATVVE